MSNIVNPLVEDYINNLMYDREINMQELRTYALENNVPIITPEVTMFLNVMTKIKEPQNILELGTAIGYSAINFSNAFDEAAITTIERNEKMIELAEKNIIENQKKQKINILKGNVEDVLPTITGKFDLIFIDASKGHYKAFFDLCLEKLAPKGIIISDNVLYKGMIASDEFVVKRKITIVKRMREFLKYIADDHRLVTSILPIGDGIAISILEK